MQFFRLTLPGTGFGHGFLFVDGTLLIALPQVQQIDTETQHQQYHSCQYQQDTGAYFGKDGNETLGDQSTENAAALQGHTVDPQIFRQCHIPGIAGFDHEQMDQGTQDHREQQHTPYAQTYRTAAMEKQNECRSQQHGRHQKKSAADQAFHRPIEKIDENGFLMGKVANGRKDSQQQTDHRSHFPSDRLGGGGVFFLLPRLAEDAGAVERLPPLLFFCVVAIAVQILSGVITFVVYNSNAR